MFWTRVNVSASLFRSRRSTLWWGLSRCPGRRSILWRAEGAVSTNHSGRDIRIWHDVFFQISWQAQHFVSGLKSGASFAKIMFFQLCKNIFIRKIRTKSALFKLKVWNLKEVSYEILVLALQTFKVKNHFRVLRGRRKILEVPKLRAWKVEECCREAFEKGVGEECCREVLGKSVGEECWRRVL